MNTTSSRCFEIAWITSSVNISHPMSLWECASPYVQLIQYLITEHLHVPSPVDVGSSMTDRYHLLILDTYFKDGGI